MLYPVNWKVIKLKATDRATFPSCNPPLFKKLEHLFRNLWPRDVSFSRRSRSLWSKLYSGEIDWGAEEDVREGSGRYGLGRRLQLLR